MTTRAALQPGTLLEERYRIVSILRAGGMGALYEARDTRLADSPCAVKEMLPQHDGTANTDYVRRRFLEEMKVLARLNHPDIPRVRDFFVEGGLNYIVMDLVEGSNLLDALAERGQPLPVSEVVRLGLAILAILEYLHSHTPPTVHRDVKPANILIERDSGRFKLVDFGLACDASSGATVHTQVGTLGYCPLEQIQGRAGPRSDIYALGATMHHLLTNEVPVPLQVKPLAKVRPDLPPHLIEVINRALASKPEDRFEARSFRLALEEVQEGLGNIPQPPAPPADSDPTGLIAPPGPHAEPYAAPPTVLVVRDSPWAYVTVGIIFFGMMVGFGYLMRGPATPAPLAAETSLAPPVMAALETPAPRITPTGLAQANPPRPVWTPPSGRLANPRRSPEAEPVRPTPPPARSAPRAKPVAVQPAYPTARPKARPTPAPSEPVAPTPPPAQPPQSFQTPQPPPGQPQQSGPPQPPYSAASAPADGRWPGHPDEPWPTENGRPLGAVRDANGNLWPSRHGKVPAHQEPEGRPGQGGPGPGGPQGGPGQGGPGQGGPRQGPPGY